MQGLRWLSPILGGGKHSVCCRHVLGDWSARACLNNFSRHIILRSVLSNNKTNPLQEEAYQTLSLLVHWARVDTTALGRPQLAGQTAVNSLAVPMMLLHVIDEVCADDEARRSAHSQDEDWAVEKILQHVQVESPLCGILCNL